MQYPGGKNCAGTFQRIINLIPPHELYVEPFLGSGAILRLKRPAAASVVYDLNQAAIDLVKPHAPPHTSLWCKSGIDALADLASDCFGYSPWEVFVYADPPYLPSTLGDRKYYAHGMTEADHVAMIEQLQKLSALGCYVMLSGYPSKLYNERLPDWRSITFYQITRGGRLADECLWMNYDEPKELHDYRFLGESFRERERLGRLQQRWIRRFRALPVVVQRALLLRLQLASRFDPAQVLAAWQSHLDTHAASPRSPIAARGER